jgi:hypothetical protein
MLVSLVVMGFILTLPIPQIAIDRLGTMDFEHLFGVTRVANCREQSRIKNHAVIGEVQFGHANC